MKVLYETTMDEDKNKISVISIKCLPSNENRKENIKRKEEIHDGKEASAWNICHVFSVLIICDIFAVPVTLIPRTNSIFYQSSWFEFNFVMMGILLLSAANDILNVATYFKEKSLLCFRMLLKTYSLYIVIWTVPYLIAYMIWCQYLEYNWPIPFLGYKYIIMAAVRPATIWILFPRSLRAKKGSHKNFQLYYLYIINGIAFAVLREGLSFLFKSLPGNMQWIVAFLVPLLKHFQTISQSRLINRMTGAQDEASRVLLGLAINLSYSFFIAVRLKNAEMITVCCIIAVDFLLQLKMTYKITQLHNVVNGEMTDNRNTEKRRMVTKLALAELTECMTPILYAMMFSFAYYGYNATILGNVKNEYWGYRLVDDVPYLFQMMILLFAVDALSAWVNSFIISTVTKTSLFRQCCRIMKRYWHFFAVRFALKSTLMFATKDINLGMDVTGEWNWITNDGRLSMINGSIDLSNEEKYLLLNQSMF